MKANPVGIRVNATSNDVTVTAPNQTILDNRNEFVQPSSQESQDFDTGTQRKRYPTRLRRAPERLSPRWNTVILPPQIAYHDSFLYDSQLNSGHTTMTQQFDLFDILKQDEQDIAQLESMHPLAFAARANAEDTP